MPTPEPVSAYLASTTRSGGPVKQAFVRALVPLRKTKSSSVPTVVSLIGLVLMHAWDGEYRASPPPVSIEMRHQQTRLLTGRNEAYVLELRSADMSAQRWGDLQLWRKITEAGSNDTSFLALEDPAEAYSKDKRDLGLTNDLTGGAIFRAVASFAVEYWPIPTFAVGPPQHPDEISRPAHSISNQRRGAHLPFNLFLWEDEEMTTSGQGSIERLFDFFDANPDVPSVVLIATDGDYQRLIVGAPGTAAFDRDLDATKIINGHAGILVTRSDRVDRYLRPFVNKREGEVRLRDTHSVGTQFWRYYWRKNNGREPGSFFRHYEEVIDTRQLLDGAPVMSSTWWHTQLPAFWASIGSQGKFKPTGTLPIRWTAEQLKQFDDAPLVGYLHRPVSIELRGKDGIDLAGADLIAAVRDGWKRALAPLEPGAKPQRIFYDSNGNGLWTHALTTALADGPTPLKLNDEPVGYDLHYRIGDLGATSALSQIVLATMAGHDDGKVSATINLGTQGRADILVVTPPDEAQRNKNLHGSHAYELFGETR